MPVLCAKAISCLKFSLYTLYICPISADGEGTEEEVGLMNFPDR